MIPVDLNRLREARDVLVELLGPGGVEPRAEKTVPTDVRWINDGWTVGAGNFWAVHRHVAFCPSCGRSFAPDIVDMLCECDSALIEAWVEWSEWVPKPDPLETLLLVPVKGETE